MGRTLSWSSWLRQDLVEPFRRHATVDGLVDHDSRRARAVAEAIHGLEAEAAVARRLVKVDAELLARVVLERARAHRLAGFCAADVHGLLTGRRGSEEMVKGDDAVHLGARQVQHL